MHRDGCADAQKVGGRGDNGVDVKATDPYGRRWVIRCKHRKAGRDHRSHDIDDGDLPQGPAQCAGRSQHSDRDVGTDRRGRRRGPHLPAP
ncbi:restriction endonuclease [Streptomyces sp. NBC_00091]|nr:restriction endonuclease [Streptomyces sp. NBC_00091]